MRRQVRSTRLFVAMAVLSGLLLLTPASATAAPTDPAFIKALAADAYVWGLGPEYIERFSKYNTIIGAPFNAFKYGGVPSAWNNEATNAGDASVLYISGFTNFTETPALVLTVPPAANEYIVVAYMDAYANAIGSIGTRTTPSDVTTSYLLVGPDSPYAGQKSAIIGGYEYPVMASDTNVNWFLIRILANTLIDASDPTSVPNITSNVTHKFALNSLDEFQSNGNQPIYPASFFLPPPTPDQIAEAAPYQNAPLDAVEFFTQVGDAVVTNPIPGADTGLSGTLVADLPSYVVPQANAGAIYRVPSYGQQAIFRTFAPLGLTETGFTVPSGWGPEQLQALQDGYELGQTIVQDFIDNRSSDPDTNYWGMINDPVGTYPNTQLGYLIRSVIVIEGGVANYGLDAIYPTLTGNPLPLDGNSTYKLTFKPPQSSYSTYPVKDIIPPMVNDANGNPKGFWSIHVYATDPTQGAAPFIAQTSLLNTSYSQADNSVLSVDAATDTMTVNAPNWGPLVRSTPILFGDNASAFGLTPNTVYYIASDPVPNANQTAYTFQVSTQWLQPLSAGNVPIQGPGGNPGPIVDLLSPSGAGGLSYGQVKPVTQLGSTQLAADQMVRNADGSLTMWFGPSLPAGAPASNWIPTPSTDYYNALYPGTPISTAFQLTLRMYYPSPGDQPPSILPCPRQVCGEALQQSYIPPAPELVSPLPPTSAGRFVPVTPVRMLDTREGIGAPAAKPGAGTALDVQIEGDTVPAEAMAVALNVTVTEPDGPGYATVYPTGSARPDTSDVNVSDQGEVAANAVAVALDPAGEVSVFTYSSAHLVADITGYWIPATSASYGRFTPTTPARLLDTRQTGRIGADTTVTVPVLGRGGVPASGVAGVALTVTYTEVGAPGYVTVWPSGQSRPLASTLNPNGPDDIRSNLVMIPVGADGAVSVYTYAGAQLVVDVAGWFTDDTAPDSTTGLFVAASRTRAVDTRTPPPDRIAANATLQVDLAPYVGAGSLAAFVNLTATNTTGGGYFTAIPSSGSQPLASTVNWSGPDQSRAAAAVVTPALGIYAFDDADAIIDVSGWFTP